MDFVCEFKNVRHILDLTKNLISIGQLTDATQHGEH